MANNRKVQGEIDKLIKKIDEGKEIYDEVYEKFKDAPSQPLKERFEGDLKKEIKKLQRLREQVKGFIQNPEVKDKRQLEEKRREIEEKMEDFKVCERETKTKAYSKEGLANARNDANDTPLGHTQGWINDALSELQQQLETAEFDVQEAGGGGGGKKRRGKGAGKGADNDDPRVVRLARLKKHVMRLEQLLRMLTNEELEPSEVDDIEEAIQEMIENNANDDYESDGDIYEQFALPEVVVKDDDEEEQERERQRVERERAAAAAAAALEKKNAAAAAAAAKEKEAAAAGGRVIVMETKKKDSDAAKSTPTTAATPPDSSTPLSKAKSVPTPTAAAAIPAPSTPNTPASPASTAAKKQPEAPAAQLTKKAAVPLPSLPSAPVSASSGHTPTTPSATSAAAVGSPSAAAGGAYTVPTAAAVNDRFTKTSSYMLDAPLEEDQMAALEEDGMALDDDMDAANDDTFGDDVMPAAGGNSGSLADLASMTASATATNRGDWGKGRPSTLTPSAQTTTAATNNTKTTATTTTSTTAAAATTAKPAGPVAPQPAALSPTSPNAPQMPGSGNSAATPTGAGAKINPMALLNKRKDELANMLRPLDVSNRNLPQPSDVERTKATPPANPTVTPECFPSRPFRGFNNPELLRKFDPESLFFIFYYQQSSYLQYLAAKELKRLGFRYHTKFHTWFQRHEKPSVTHEQYEQGSYIYFDYENGWCQRVKRDFQFKYMYLEDDLE